MKPYRVGLVFILVCVVAGCGGGRQTRRTKQGKPVELPPVKIIWSEPISVVEGFFDAKKRGDWRKAFDCCDFEERLGAEEAKKIRAEWKKEAPEWPRMYRYSRWFVIDGATEGDYALVSVRHIEWVGPGTGDTKSTGFEDLLKRYGDRWKISDFQLIPKEQ